MWKPRHVVYTVRIGPKSLKSHPGRSGCFSKRFVLRVPPSPETKEEYSRGFVSLVSVCDFIVIVIVMGGGLPRPDIAGTGREPCSLLPDYVWSIITIPTISWPQPLPFPEVEGRGLLTAWPRDHRTAKKMVSFRLGFSDSKVDLFSFRSLGLQSRTSFA